MSFYFVVVKFLHRVTWSLFEDCVERVAQSVSLFVLALDMPLFWKTDEKIEVIFKI